MYRKISLFIIIGLMSLLIVTAGPVYGASQVASVLSVQGNVLVKSTYGDWKTPTLAMGLYKGDRIVVYKNSYAVIGYYSDGHMEYLTYQSGDYFVAEIGSTKSASVWGGGYITSMVQSGSISISGTQTITQKVGGVTGRVFPIIVKIPVIISGNPVFRWSPMDAENNEHYIFTLSNGYELETDETEVLYSGEPLERGETYTWSVKIKDILQPPATCNIYILSNEELAEVNSLMENAENQALINPDENTHYVEAADELLYKGLFSEALEYYIKAKLVKPEEPDKELDDMINTLDTYLKKGLIPEQNL